jgi:oxalate decarboxylase/phosphoglucose isomerase-like protein (cupin superfamily)/mannose-6-phosphate isomerase-like protein (cupin superfamily)
VTTTAEQTQELPRMERLNAYAKYQEGEGVPVYRGFAVEDLRTLELAPWARKSARGAFINLDGTGGTNDAYVLEIPPRGQTNVQRHIYEEMVYVLDGSGSTSVWYDENSKVTFEWGRGSLFAIPLNANYQHFNGSGSSPARYLAVTDAPTIISLFHNLKFVFENPFAFDDRFGGEDNYFSGEAKVYQRRVLETNFVADADSIELYSWAERGAGGRITLFELAHNTMAAHISEFPVGTYKKAHRHGPGAHVIILSGQGYSLLWPEGEEIKEVPWRPGTMVVPPENWFHQHFNSGAEPTRYLALRWGSKRYEIGGAFSSDTLRADVSVKEGGLQIEYEDEDKNIHRVFEDHLSKAGATCHMKSMTPWCTGPGELKKNNGD